MRVILIVAVIAVQTTRINKAYLVRHTHQSSTILHLHGLGFRRIEFTVHGTRQNRRTKILTLNRHVERSDGAKTVKFVFRQLSRHKRVYLKQITQVLVSEPANILRACQIGRCVQISRSQETDRIIEPYDAVIIHREERHHMHGIHILVNLPRGTVPVPVTIRDRGYRVGLHTIPDLRLHWLGAGHILDNVAAHVDYRVNHHAAGHIAEEEHGVSLVDEIDIGRELHLGPNAVGSALTVVADSHRNGIILRAVRHIRHTHLQGQLNVRHRKRNLYGGRADTSIRGSIRHRHPHQCGLRIVFQHQY